MSREISKELNFITVLLLLSIAFILSGCTYSINMVHTAGHAEDVIDETQSNDQDISPHLKIPIKGL